MQNFRDLLNQNIIGLLGLQALPEAEKAETINKMTELAVKRIMLRVVEKLTEEQAAEIATMANDEDKVFAYLDSQVPDFMEIVKEEILKIKEEMLNLAK